MKRFVSHLLLTPWATKVLIPSQKPPAVPNYMQIYVGIFKTLGLALAGLLGVVAWFASTAMAVQVAIVSTLIIGGIVLGRYLEFRSLNHIPGPRPSFVLGNLDDLLAQHHGGRDQALLALHRQYGPVLRLHLGWGSRPFVSVSFAPRALTRRDLDSNREADRTVFPHGLMGLRLGPVHQTHRRTLRPSFQTKAVRKGFRQIEETSRKYIECWHTENFRHGHLQADIHHWSAHSLGRFMFGSEWDPPGGGDRHLTEYLQALAAIEEVISLRAFHPFFVSPSNKHGKGYYAYRYLHDFLEPIFKQRSLSYYPSKPSEDVLDILVSAVHDTDKPSWTTQECIEEMMSLVAGGTDAMSYTVSQALMLLSRHEEIQQQAYEALVARGPNDKLPKLIQNIILETLRLHPPVPFSSKVAKNLTIDELGLAIPDGVNIMWMKTAAGRDKAQFKAPETFNPNRHDRKTHQNPESIQPILPFGAGPRSCIGRYLGEMMCASFLALIIENFHLLPDDHSKVTYSATVAVTPSHVPVSLLPRNP